MKNKIRCLFNNLADKLNNIDGEHYLAFFGAFMTIFLIAAMILAPMSASAADDDSTMTLKAGTYRFNGVPTETYPLTQSFDFTLIVNADGEVIEEAYTGIETEVIDGSYRIGATQSSGLIAIYLNPVPSEIADIYPNGWIGGSILMIKIDVDTEVNIAFGSWFIATTNYNEVNGGTPTQCPTLEEQIADYSGSWVQFINMVRQNNPTLGNSYQNVVDEAILAGKISVEGDYIVFDGTYDDLVQLLMSTSNNNPNIQAALEQELQRQFENGVAGGYDDGYSDGKDYGQEIGYKEGQMDGYNKGASDSLVQNFFGNFLQGIVQAVDSIHFYEIIDDQGTPDVKDDVVEFYISPWSILVIFIGLALVLIFLKVFRGG